MNPDTLRLKPTPEGSPTLEYLRSDGSWIPLHSRYRPREEARRWVQGLDRPLPGHLTLVGMGLGYAVAEILKASGGDLRSLFVIESVPEIVEIARRENPAHLPWDHAGFEVLCAPDPQDVYRLLSSRMANLLVEGFGYAPLPFIADRGLRADGVHLESLSRFRAELDSAAHHMRTQGSLIQDHLIANLPMMATSGRLGKLVGYAKGTPAVVVGAGPSLDGNIQALRGAHERALVFAADTIAPRLQSEGIVPHVVASKDAHEANLHHLLAIPEPGATTLAFDPQLHPDGVRLPFAARLLVPNRCRRIHEIIPSLGLGGEDCLPLGHTAIHTSFSLAVHLGCGPIVFAGVDLAFPRHGGTSHADGTALQTQVTVGESMHYHGDARRGIADDPGVGIVWVDGVDGGPVPTSPGFADALQCLGQLVRESARHVVDATEGGARIAGTELTDLREALDALQPIAAPSPTQFARRVCDAILPVRDQDVWRNELRNALGILSGAAESAKALLSRLDADASISPPTMEALRSWRAAVRGLRGAGCMLEAALEADEIQVLRYDANSIWDHPAHEAYQRYLQAFLTASSRYTPMFAGLCA